MSLAAQQDVVKTIKQFTLTGTPAEVLAAVDGNSITQTRNEKLTWEDIEDILTPAKVSALDQIMSTEPSLTWLRESLSGSGVNFSRQSFQDKIDALKTAGKLTQQDAGMIKRIGVWKVSPLESMTTKGTTTDLATVTAAIAEIGAEPSLVYDTRKCSMNLVIQANGKINLSIRVVEAADGGQEKNVRFARSTADADNATLPQTIVNALALIRKFVAEV